MNEKLNHIKRETENLINKLNKLNVKELLFIKNGLYILNYYDYFLDSNLGLCKKFNEATLCNSDNIVNKIKNKDILSQQELHEVYMAIYIMNCYKYISNNEIKLK